MRIAAIIPSLANDKTKAYLRLCVESLRATTDWDIIVVTNGAHAPEPLNIDGITMRLHTRDQGQCNAVNIGAQVANADYLFIVNDDMYFAPGWNRNLRFNYPVFSPNLIEPTDNTGSAAPFLKLDAGFTLTDFDKDKVDDFVANEDIMQFKKFAKLNDDNNLDPIRSKSFLDATIEPGLNFPLFIRKDVWDTIGGYDVAYDPWGSNSDTDLQTKINLAGITPMRLRDVLVYHFSSKSGTFDGTHQDFYMNNIEYFKQKFGFDRDELGSDVWYNKDMLPEDLTNIKFKADWIGKYAKD